MRESPLEQCNQELLIRVQNSFACWQTPEAVVEDMSPAERLKYEGHWSKVKGSNGWVETSRAKVFFSKAALPVHTSFTIPYPRP